MLDFFHEELSKAIVKQIKVKIVSFIVGLMFEIMGLILKSETVFYFVAFDQISSDFF